MPVLGIDIGGTKIAAGVVDSGARVLESAVVPARAAEGFAVSFAQLEAAIEATMRDDVTAIGICAPGPLNPKTGVVINPPNLPGWVNVPLAERISRAYGLPCRVENDANAAGLAEALFGAARGYSTVFYVTVSTGIGSGIVLDGKIHHGKSGQAGEGGHVTIDYRSDSICGCGTPGCIEALASGTAIARRAGMPAEEVGCAAAKGDARAIGILEETALMLAAWLGSVVNLLDPDIIVIGGGVAQIGEPLFSRLRALVPARSINQFAAETPIVPAALGPHSGILGAAATVFR
jgi:glucokinase